VQSTHFNTGLRSFLEDLRHRRLVKTAAPCLLGHGCVPEGYKEPKEHFWKAPDDGFQSNSLNRWPDSMQFIQFNICQARWPEKRYCMDRTNASGIPNPESADRQGPRLLVPCFASGCANDCLVVHEAKNASWVAKIELCPGSAAVKTRRPNGRFWTPGVRRQPDASAAVAVLVDANR
jgi:hypothetical protein